MPFTTKHELIEKVERIIEKANNAGEPANAAKVAQYLKITPDGTRKKLNDMVEKGFLVRVHVGNAGVGYILPDYGNLIDKFNPYHPEPVEPRVVKPSVPEAKWMNRVVSQNVSDSTREPITPAELRRIKNKMRIGDVFTIRRIVFDGTDYVRHDVKAEIVQKTPYLCIFNDKMQTAFQWKEIAMQLRAGMVGKGVLLYE